jgi:hypothetical protein
MAQNIDQIYTVNPSTTIAADDLFYLGLSPYAPSDDSAIKWSDLVTAIIAEGAGGSTTQIQYNNAGALGGDTGFTTDGAGTLSAVALSLTTALPVTSGGTGLASTTANQLLYSSATSTIAGLATANNGLLVTSAAGVPSIGNAVLADITVNGVTVGEGASSVLGNSAFGVSALSSVTSSTESSAFGYEALKSVASSVFNSAFGYEALTLATSEGNSAFGARCLNNLTTGQHVTAVGALSLDALVTVSDVTAMGYASARNVTAGTLGVYVGSNCLSASASPGLGCTIVGGNAASSTTTFTADTCTGVGAYALNSTTSGSSSSCVGYRVLQHVTTAVGNSAVGYISGSTTASGSAQLTTGGHNTLLGFETGVNDNATAGTISLGAHAVSTIATGATSGDDGPGIAIGSAAYPVGFRGDATIYPGAFGRVKWNGTQYMLPLQADGATSIAVTSGGTGLSSTTANQLLYSSATDTIAGLATANNGLLVTSAAGVPSIGNAILANITVNGIEVGKGANSVANNTAVGAGALDGAVTGGGNTAIGQNALTNLTTGTLNTAVGYNALAVVSNASNNTALGVSAGTALNGGGRNTAIGVSALLKATSGGGNTAVGMETLVNITTTSFNTALGDSALVLATTADSNTAIGYGSGRLGATGALSLLTGDKNTFLGFQSCADDAAAAGTLALGADAVSTIATGATSGDNGPGIAIGSAAYPVGFRGDATIYPGAFGRVKWNGTQYMLPLQADGATSIAVTSGGTGTTTSTGTGSVVLSNTPTLVTPALGAATATSINFGQDALNYYDEGTFTPTLKFDGGITGITYTTQQGDYIRVGNLVTFTIHILLSNKGSDTGSSTITLPFAVGGSTGIQYNCAMTTGNLTYTADYLTGYYAEGGSVLYPTNCTSGTGSAFIADTAFANTTNLIITGTYSVV